MAAIHYSTPQPAHDQRLLRAQEFRAAQARRDALFDGDADIFGDPAWDILLALYTIGQRSAAVGEIELPSHLSASTALRHLQELRRRGLVEIEGEPGRFRLSSRGRVKLDGYFAA